MGAKDEMKYKPGYDVIVAGGGPAGIMAALAAARTGASVLLFERNGFLGGAATNSVLGPISPFMFGDEQVINGIPQEFVDELMKVHGSTGHMKALDPYGSGAYLGFYDREKYKYVAEEMLLKAGVDIFFHTLLRDLKMEDGSVKGVVLHTKSGAYSFGCKVLVDATGDGDAAVMAGEEYVYGNADTGKAQPGSAMFEMVDVDTDKVYDYIFENPDDFEWKSDIVPVRPYSGRLKQHYFVAQGFKSLVKKAVAAGDLNFGRDSVIVLNGIHPGSIHFNATRVSGYNSTDAVEKSYSEIDGRRQIESVSEFMIKYVPGFEKSYVSVTSNEVGVRETRHIKGLYTLTQEDAGEGRKFDDVVSRGYFPMDVHNPDGVTGYTEGGHNGGCWFDLKDTYDIPFRCLIPARIKGLVLSGRCISGTSVAHGSYRTQGGIMGIGQASGVIAGLAAVSGTEPRDLDVKKVQETLIGYGASVFRDEEKKAREEAHARESVREYMKGRTKYITKKEIIDGFMK
ncbi:FAD-dependent oxidoreductase [Breznakiella homolactica]|uniref:FAD-dependent oxidoreductase n=1 Tax=Breznakiella homolactica TaxID=2798577 RepID=A0A7T7XK62_9SPIR|nr:FAD-dependent oxidoreductase [Breznakiella homolactica]QQO07904.1 FAD-dependent oxidoreductase [Breznakiella homolactica]